MFISVPIILIILIATFTLGLISPILFILYRVWVADIP